jgi:outer membrane protein
MIGLLRFSVILVAWVSLGVPVRAEDLFDIYLEALNKDPVFLAAGAQRLATYEAVPQARALLLPNIRLDADADLARQNFMEGLPDGGTTHFSEKSYTLSLTQTLYNRDRFILQRQADKRVKQADADYEAVRQDLIVRVADRYFNVLAAQDNLEFARAERIANERRLEQTEQRFRVGLIAITDVHEAQAAYDLSTAREIQAENLLDNAIDELAELIGRQPGVLSILQQDVPLIKPDPPDIDQWVDAASESNLQIIAARYNAEIARDEIERQRSQHYPTLDLVGSHNFTDLGGGRLGGSRGTEIATSRIGVQLGLSLYEGGRVTSQVRESRERFEEAVQGLAGEQRATTRQTRSSYLNILSDISQVKAFKQSLVSTRSALEATQAGYEVGTRTIVDVLEVQRTFFEAKRDYARSRYDYILDTLRLKQAVGILRPADLEAVNEWLEDL